MCIKGDVLRVYPPDLGHGSLVQTKRNISGEVHQCLNIGQPSVVTLQRGEINKAMYST